VSARQENHNNRTTRMRMKLHPRRKNGHILVCDIQVWQDFVFAKRFLICSLNVHHLYTMYVLPIGFSMLSIVSRFGCAWLYYGIVLLTTTLIQNDPHCGKFSACFNLNKSPEWNCGCELCRTHSR